MSTAAAMREFERSWSEENLQRLQAKEKIEELEKRVAELTTTVATMTTTAEQQAAKIAEQDTEIDRLRVKLYDAQQQAASHLRSHKKKKKAGAASGRPIKQKTHKSGHAPVDKKNKAANEARAKWAEREARARALLEQLESSGSKTDVTSDTAKAAGPAEGDMVEQPAGDAERATTATPALSEFEHDAGFDLVHVAEVFPQIPLLTVLKAEAQFLSADADGSGLIDADEFDQMLKAINASVDRAQVDKIVADAGIDISQGLDFTECLHILMEYEAQAAKGKGASGKGGKDSSAASNVCTVQ